MSHPLKWHLWRSLYLALPIILMQVFDLAIAITDTVMVGRLGELSLAQITLGADYLVIVQLAFAGFAIALTPLISKAHGAGEDADTRHIFRMGLWQAAIISLVSIFLCFVAEDVFIFLNQDPIVIKGAVDYLNIALWSLPFFTFMRLFRNFWVGYERSHIFLFINLFGFVVNIIGNYALIFGHFGAPKMGLNGSAVSTVLTTGLMFLVSLIVMIFESRRYKQRLFHTPWHFHKDVFMRLLKLGVPISFGLISEVGMFQATTIMMGWIGVTELAAHGVVFQVVTANFMVPLGIGIMVTARVGNALGRGDETDLRHVASSATILVLSYAFISMLVFLLIPEKIIILFLDPAREDTARIMMFAVGFLGVAALFQVFDEGQMVFMGILRGFQDATRPALVGFLAYWGIGVPAAYILGFPLGFGGKGIWYGVLIGLVLMFFWLAHRLWKRVYKIDTLKQNVHSI